jgi:hypothetical protein
LVAINPYSFALFSVLAQQPAEAVIGVARKPKKRVLNGPFGGRHSEWQTD